MLKDSKLLGIVLSTAAILTNIVAFIFDVADGPLVWTIVSGFCILGSSVCLGFWLSVDNDASIHLR